MKSIVYVALLCSAMAGCNSEAKEKEALTCSSNQVRNTVDRMIKNKLKSEGEFTKKFDTDSSQFHLELIRTKYQGKPLVCAAQLEPSLAYFNNVTVQEKQTVEITFKFAWGDGVIYQVEETDDGENYIVKIMGL